LRICYQITGEINHERGIILKRVHASDEAACRQTAQSMSEAASVENYTLLFSRKELKKTSMVYFPAEE